MTPLTQASMTSFMIYVEVNDQSDLRTQSLLTSERTQKWTEKAVRILRVRVVLSACGEQLNGRGRIVHRPISPFHFTSTCHAVLSSSLLPLFSLPKNLRCTTSHRLHCHQYGNIRPPPPRVPYQESQTQARLHCIIDRFSNLHSLFFERQYVWLWTSGSYCV